MVRMVIEFPTPYTPQATAEGNPRVTRVSFPGRAVDSKIQSPEFRQSGSPGFLRCTTCCEAADSPTVPNPFQPLGGLNQNHGPLSYDRSSACNNNDTQSRDNWYAKITTSSVDPWGPRCSRIFTPLGSRKKQMLTLLLCVHKFIIMFALTQRQCIRSIRSPMAQ